MGKARYRLSWSNEFDKMVRRVAEREGMSMEKYIQQSAALYGALSNMAKEGSRFIIVHKDGGQEEFLWDRGATETVEEGANAVPKEASSN